MECRVGTSFYLRVMLWFKCVATYVKRVPVGPAVHRCNPIMKLLTKLATMTLLLIIITTPIQSGSDNGRIITAACPLCLTTGGVTTNASIGITALSNTPTNYLRSCRLSPTSHLTLRRTSTILAGNLNTRPFLRKLSLPIISAATKVASLLYTTRRRNRRRSRRRRSCGRRI